MNPLESDGMNDGKAFSIYTLRLRNERHVVHARQRAREIANLLGFEHQDQIRLATAASEIARNAFRYATGGAVEFLVRAGDPQCFILVVTDAGPGINDLVQILDGHCVSKTGLGQGIVGTKRLMEYFEITSSRSGTRVETGKRLPRDMKPVDAARVREIVNELARSGLAEPFDEIERQNQELLRTLAELREKQETLALLNRELEDTNRGVVALYAELDQRAIDLRRASDMKTSFLSNLSHEFRTPLNSITSLTRLLLSHTDGELEAEQEKQIIFIQRSASELSELVNDLLDLAKVEAGKIDVKAKLFEVDDLFGALRGMLKPLLVGNSLDLIFEADPGLPPLFTDEGKVSQILRNLISNALKFTRRGYVKVSAKIEGERIEKGRSESDNPRQFVQFRVEDTGIGIRPADQQRIFEEFVQVDGDLQAQVKGTGLGLPLSRRLAELLEGTLEVQSVEGMGSTFIVTLPMYIGDPSLASHPRIESKAPIGPTVLFIEDNRETIFVLESSLKNTKYHLIFAPTIPEARIAMKRIKPALVVLDRLIEKEDCLFFISELRSIDYTGPILVVSVVDEPQVALDAGASLFLPKPVPPFTLVNGIRQLIDGDTARTILLSDDDEVTRYLMGEVLAGMGFRILEARNGRESIHMASAYHPDLMILDIVMPDLNGFEVLREIRDNPATQGTPVVIHSSKIFTEQEDSFLRDSGALIYPKQPLGDRQSERRLREILSSAGLQP